MTFHLLAAEAKRARYAGTAKIEVRQLYMAGRLRIPIQLKQ
jgi:hypothetical protein